MATENEIKEATEVLEERKTDLNNWNLKFRCDTCMNTGTAKIKNVEEDGGGYETMECPCGIFSLIEDVACKERELNDLMIGI